MTHADAYRRHDADRRFLMSREWRERIRPRQLGMQPLCEFCQMMGRVRKADHVDHIERPKGRRELQISFSNFRSLCVDCHARKTAWERRADGTDLVIGHDTAGWPITITSGGGIQSENRVAAKPAP